MAAVRRSPASESLMAAMVTAQPSNGAVRSLLTQAIPFRRTQQSNTHDAQGSRIQQSELQNPLLVDATWVGAICDVAIAALTACKLRRCVEVTQTASANKNIQRVLEESS